MSRPLLIVLGGLPGTGKTTLARMLARRLGAVHLRIDSIEQAIHASGTTDVGVAGYTVGNALARDNLMLGLSVIADCVNPVAASRQGWADSASAAAARLVQVHFLCSDLAEHRRRIEGRMGDLDGLVPPDWAAVQERVCEPWHGDVFQLETSRALSSELADQVIRYIAQ